MNKYLNALHWLLVIVVAASVLLTGKTSLALWQTNQVNEFITSPSDFDTVPEQAKAQFAQSAYEVEQNKTEQALERLTSVLNTDDNSLEAAAYFNRANINLRSARALPADDAARIALIGLAKQDYRTAVLIEPTLWDARYNLELALLMAPESIAKNKKYSKRKGAESVVVKVVGFRVDLP